MCEVLVNSSHPRAATIPLLPGPILLTRGLLLLLLLLTMACCLLLASAVSTAPGSCSPPSPWSSYICSLLLSPPAPAGFPRVSLWVGPPLAHSPSHPLPLSAAGWPVAVCPGTASPPGTSCSPAAHQLLTSCSSFPFCSSNEMLPSSFLQQARHVTTCQIKFSSRSKRQTLRAPLGGARVGLRRYCSL